MVLAGLSPFQSRTWPTSDGFRAAYHIRPRFSRSSQRPTLLANRRSVEAFLGPNRGSLLTFYRRPTAVDAGYNPGYSQGPEARGPNPEKVTDRPCLSGLRKGGVEPPRPCGHRILSPARLPVPPLPHGCVHTLASLTSRKLQVFTPLRAGDCVMR